MNLALIEKFILELSPPQAKIAVSGLFESMRTQPAMTIMQGFGLLSDVIKDEGSETSIAAVNGLCLGIALTYCTHNDKNLEKMIEGFVEMSSRNKGENVIDFFKARARK
jgi:hypothetical protein